MSEVLIKVDHLSKKFCRSLKRSMYYGVTDTLKTMAGVNYSTDTLRPSEFWSLNDISFELRKGETLGILGANGSGKSTLLRLLAGIFPPDHGKIEINGNIGALIAVGAGFHPHMTGYENIYLNGTILGLTKDRIDEIIDEITSFSEIPEDALNAPVATYSSGMKVRLGFSVAMHCEPDILLVDEVLSVGDIGFKNKALSKMEEYKLKANGLVFISHDIEQMRLLSDRIIVLDKGNIVYQGDPFAACVYYEGIMRNNTLSRRLLKGNKLHQKNKSSFSNEIIDFLGLGLIDDFNQTINSIQLNSELNIFIDFKVNELIKNLTIYVPITPESNPNNYCVDMIIEENEGFKLSNIEIGEYRLNIKLKKHNLNTGVYQFGTITFRNNKSFITYNKTRLDSVFKVKSDYKTLERGYVYTESVASINKLN